MDMQRINNVLDNSYNIGKAAIPEGEVASYIPELAKANKSDLGIALITRKLVPFSVGDCETRFTVQSISKVVSLCVALEEYGFSRVFCNVGMEPSGEAFNSIVELDLQSNKPFNPMINSGAIAIENMLLKRLGFDELVTITRKLCNDKDISLNNDVYLSEMSTASRNRAIAYLLDSKEIVKGDVEATIELYTKMCSLNVTAKSLANLGLTLALGGLNPYTGERLLKPETVKVVKTIMLTCGMYDGSGQFAVEVGLPTKSGVGGGLLSVVDKEMGIGIYGPSLDEKGNCVAGKAALKNISSELGLHLFYS